METSRYQLDFIRAAIDQLQDYLISEQVYWPIGIPAPAGYLAYPQLTLGTLLLFLHQAQAIYPQSPFYSEFTRSKKDIEDMKGRWLVHWRNKAGAEFKARIKLWGNFLEEYRKDPEGNFDRYAYEVNRRVLLELLGNEVSELSDSEEKLLGILDHFLRSVLTSADFIWNDGIESEFPQEVFWYLYGDLPASWTAPR